MYRKKTIKLIEHSGLLRQSVSAFQVVVVLPSVVLLVYLQSIKEYDFDHNVSIITKSLCKVNKDCFICY